MYLSYAIALNKCTTHAYQNHQIIKAVIEKTIRFKDRLNDKKIVNMGELKTLAGIGMALKSAKSAHVLDFGGGGGYHYFLTKQFFPQVIELHWRVVETANMVAEAKKMATAELDFVSNITEAKNDLGKID